MLTKMKKDLNENNILDLDSSLFKFLDLNRLFIDEFDYVELNDDQDDDNENDNEGNNIQLDEEQQETISRKAANQSFPDFCRQKRSIQFNFKFFK